MSKHECERSRLEEVEITDSDGSSNWQIIIKSPTYKVDWKEFIENINYCPWCGVKLEDV